MVFNVLWTKKARHAWKFGSDLQGEKPYGNERHEKCIIFINSRTIKSISNYNLFLTGLMTL